MLLKMVSLPQGFGFLHAFCPYIRQSIRYSTSYNFLGRVVEGYSKPYTCLTDQCIKALSHVQKAANVMGYDLLVYDGYRPARASKDFYNWAQTADDENDQSAFYYPLLSRKELFSDEHIKKNSKHNLGSTVDVSLIRRDKPLKKLKWSFRYYQGYQVPYGDDGSIDMYTSFSLFDLISKHDSLLIPSTFLEKRNLLKHLMEAHGFQSHSNQWWHYDLINPPFTLEKDEAFDFIF